MGGNLRLAAELKGDLLYRRGSGSCPATSCRVRLRTASIFDGTFGDPAFTPDGSNLFLTQMGAEFPNRIIRLNVRKTEEFMAQSRAKLDEGGVIDRGMIGEKPSVAADLNRVVLSQVAMSP